MPKCCTNSGTNSVCVACARSTGTCCWACWTVASRRAKRWRSSTPRICRQRLMHIKKRDGGYTAIGATLGGRTRKHGHSRWFVGYKKHTLRLWLHAYEPGILLVPLMSWLAPGHRGDALFLRPSLHWCQRHLHWLPDIVLADMAYINLATQRWIREHWQVCVLTKLRPDMRLIGRFEPGPVAVCHQGQRLEWLGFEPQDQLHWFGVTQCPALCDMCWEQHSCPRYFAHAPHEHEILFGSMPLSSPVAQKLITEVRAWAEGCQSYEKNQLGLKRMFFNSLRLTWMLGLLADSVSLLRARALLVNPGEYSLLRELMPQQLPLDFPHSQ